jgi:hypothetical protein
VGGSVQLPYIRFIRLLSQHDALVLEREKTVWSLWYHAAINSVFVFFHALELPGSLRTLLFELGDSG